MTTRGTRWRRGCSRLSVRLFAVVLLPVITLSGVVAANAVGSLLTASRVARVTAEIEPLTDAVRVGFALAEEGLLLQAAVEAAELRGTPEAAEDLLGLDLEVRVRDARTRTQVRLSAVRDGSWLREVVRLIDQVRERMDARRATRADLYAFERAQAIVQDRALQLSSRLSLEVSSFAGGMPVARHVHMLERSYEALITYSQMRAAFFSSIAAPDPVPVKVALAGTLARYQVLTEEVALSDDARIAQGWRRIEASTDGRVFIDLVRGWVSSPESGAERDVGAMTGVLRQAGDVWQLHLDLVEAAKTTVLTDVDTLRRETRLSALRMLLAALLIIGVALVLATLLVRGVTRPLGELAARARRLSDGDLWLDPRAGGGPREVAAVAGAFNEVVAHLRLVEEQAEALADGDTTHEALRRRAPGRLGQSLQQSVDRLSQSLAEREDLESRLRHEATHDRLTGLLNRSAAMLALEQGVARAHRHGAGLAVLVVDLDGLTRVNEALGHAGGDETLRRSASRLAAAVRGGDVVARLGADEFVVVAEVDGIDLAVALAERVVSALSALPVAGEPGHGEPASTVNASVGVAITLDGVGQPAALLHDADVAVRRAKEHGTGRVEVFDEDLRQRLAERSQLEQALREAMERGWLRLFYQPILDLEGRLVGLEALCRWSDPVLGEVPPSVFVAVAESSDLIHDLDRWVLREATRQLAAWRAEGRMDGVYLSVNLSGRHLLDPGVVDDVRAALDASRCDPRLLVLEITETVLLEDLLLAAAHLSALRGIGVRVAVDDFGTGYTSIAHLRHLPVDVVKIDRSFVSDVEGERGRSLVRLMVDIADTLGLSVVAEGVETPQEFDHLRAIGCQHVQGYLFARPMPPERLPDWVGEVATRC